MKLRSLSLSNLLSLAIPLWIASVSFPMLSLRYPFAIEGEIVDEEISRIYAVFSILIMVVSASLLIAKFGLRGIKRFSVSFILLSLFSILCVIFSCINMNTNSLFFSIILIVVVYSIRIITFECNINQINILCSLVLFSFIVSSIIMHYPPIGRYLGGMHPNVYGACLVAAAYFSLFVQLKYLRYLISISALICALLISSRYSMLAISYIILFNIISFKNLNKALSILSFSIILISIIYLISVDSGDNFISDALELSNPNRGFGSGGSGRLDLYDKFWDQFADAVVIGYGFRARDMYVGMHNGILNTILENGIFASLILFSAIAVRMFELVKIFVADGRRSYAKFYLLGIGACLFSSIFQPQLINFGDPLGVVFLLVLAAHPRPLEISEASRAGRQRVQRMSARTGLAARQPPAG